jgi:hypothetical protein
METHVHEIEHDERYKYVEMQCQYIDNQFMIVIRTQKRKAETPKSMKKMIIRSVARVRRRDKNIHPRIWQIWGDKEFLSLSVEKWNGSRHLVFWSLGTLTGLRDRVWGLVA